VAEELKGDGWEQGKMFDMEAVSPPRRRSVEAGPERCKSCGQLHRRRDVFGRSASFCPKCALTLSQRSTSSARVSLR
jgi:predicted Zn-ribbon and HTH transcriptional regulator